MQRWGGGLFVPQETRNPSPGQFRLMASAGPGLWAWAQPSPTSASHPPAFPPEPSACLGVYAADARAAPYSSLNPQAPCRAPGICLHFRERPLQEKSPISSTRLRGRGWGGEGRCRGRLCNQPPAISGTPPLSQPHPWLQPTSAEQPGTSCLPVHRDSTAVCYGQAPKPPPLSPPASL